MSKRESRTSVGIRQNDTLFEYEALKKKFLHANKAITKLNSTLSLRIEELNAELSTLYVENLRLRTSELALAAQLKRERERSRKLLADAEAAAQNLTKQLEQLSQSYKVDASPPTPPTPPSPKARRPPLVTNADVQISRLSRPPNVPEIHEEEEPAASSSDSDVDKPKPFQKREAAKSRSPTPRTSRQSRPSSPLHVDFTTTTHRKKPSRRQSGLLNVGKEPSAMQRPPSPPLGSTIRKSTALGHEGEENEVENQPKPRHSLKVEHRKRENKSKDKEPPEGRTLANTIDAKPREKKRPGDEDEHSKEAQVKNITRLALQPIDNTVQEVGEIQIKVMKTFLAPSAADGVQLQPIQSSSSGTPSEAELLNAVSNCRERRTRKSVNYAEPKLNTKMRKPDPAPSNDGGSRKKRSSAAALMTMTMFKSHDAGVEASNSDAPETTYQPIGPDIVESTQAATSTTLLSKKRTRSRPPSDDEEFSDGAEADEEYVPPGRLNWINLEGRKRITSIKRGSPADDPAFDIDSRRHSMAV